MQVDFSRVSEAIQRLQYTIDEQRKTFNSDWDDKVHASFEAFVIQNIQSKNQLQELNYKIKDIANALEDLESAQSYQSRIDDLCHTVDAIDV